MFRKCSILIGLLIVVLALTAFSSPLQAIERRGGFPWVLCVLFVVALLALLVLAAAGLFLWWWLRRRPEEEAAPPAPPEPQAPPTPDDLTRIEGIGPKISTLLQAAGITTFGQLAAAEVSHLEQILEEADLAALANPDTWPEQARLAAAGQWDALEALQSELKGGQRV